MFAPRLPSTLKPLWHRSFSTSPRNAIDFTHAVIGGGVVGLAIARQLQAREGSSTVLLERHSALGTETSSRNSEVIHAGLYYGPNTLKTKLCLRGKEKLYQLCQEHEIPHRKTGKWIVAQNAEQMLALEKIHKFATDMNIPTHFLTRQEITAREPHVRAEAGVLESPSTGIIDSHRLLQHLQFDFENHEGICALHSPVTHITPLNRGHLGWELTITPPASSSTCTSPYTIRTSTLINAAGLSAIPLSNSILPPPSRRTPFYAKGTYYTYSATTPKPKTLIYPAPVPAHPGLGTHLTLDLSGRIRFGPDVQWTLDPNDYRPTSSTAAAAIAEIKSYLPAVEASAIAPDYVGIRPKLGRLAATSGTAFGDFYIVREEGFGGFVNLLGIESPGLTACLAIAEEVEALLY